MRSDTRRIWIATEIYYPEETSTGYILTRLAEGLATEADVAVLCAQPSYERKSVRVPARERINGVEIVRVGHPRLDRNSLVGRAINGLAVAFGLFLAALRQLRSRDLVIVVTNPPLLPFAIWAAATLRRAPVALLVHDLYPEAAVLAGILAPSSAVARLWRVTTTWLFRRVDRIVVLGRDAAELIADRMPDGAARIVVIPNWADVDQLQPADPASNRLLRELGLDGRFVLGYAGNMGRVQDVEMLLAAAASLRRTAPDVHLLFVGSGAKAALVAEAARAPGSNVTLLGPRGRSEQELFLNACHVGIMALAPGMKGVGVPSRLYNLLAVGRPVVAAVDPDSEPALVLREEGAGIQTPPGDPAAFVAAIEALRGDPTFLREAGSRARQAAVNRFDFGTVLASYRGLVDEMRPRQRGE